jgi:hypothetical protein
VIEPWRPRIGPVQVAAVALSLTLVVAVALLSRTLSPTGRPTTRSLPVLPPPTKSVVPVASASRIPPYHVGEPVPLGPASLVVAEAVAFPAPFVTGADEIDVRLRLDSAAEAVLGAFTLSFGLQSGGSGGIAPSRPTLSPDFPASSSLSGKARGEGYVGFVAAPAQGYLLLVRLETSPGSVATAAIDLGTPARRPTPSVVAPSPSPSVSPSVVDRGGLIADAVSTDVAGYAASRPGYRFSVVRASWIQPVVRCPAAGTDLYAATWVGLGTSPGDALRIGTSIRCGPDSTDPELRGWYRNGSAAAHVVPLTIRAGDQVVAQIEVVKGLFRVHLKNATTGKRYEQDVRHGSAQPVAYWLMDTLDSSDMRHLLPPFEAIRMTQDRAVGNGHDGGISDPGWNATRYTMTALNTGVVRLDPGELSSIGGAFTITRHWS